MNKKTALLINADYLLSNNYLSLELKVHADFIHPINLTKLELTAFKKK